MSSLAKDSRMERVSPATFKYMKKNHCRKKIRNYSSIGRKNKRKKPKKKKYHQTKSGKTEALWVFLWFCSEDIFTSSKGIRKMGNFNITELKYVSTFAEQLSW
jgi:hypothetical protein